MCTNFHRGRLYNLIIKNSRVKIIPFAINLQPRSQKAVQVSYKLWSRKSITIGVFQVEKSYSNEFISTWGAMKMTVLNKYLYSTYVWLPYSIHLCVKNGIKITKILNITKCDKKVPWKSFHLNQTVQCKSVTSQLKIIKPVLI